MRMDNDYRELKVMELCDKLRKMRMSEMAEKLLSILNDTNSMVMDPLDVVYSAVHAEWEMRYNKKVCRYMRKATLKIPSATLDDRVYDPIRRIDTGLVERLATCEWIDKGLFLTISGKAGTGKTHLACALAICAIQKFYDVKYLKASSLLNEISAASQTNRLIEYQNQIAKYDLLVIDDFGFMNLDIEKCLHLFEILDAREGKKSTIIVSQIPSNQWYELFSDSTYADACMERLVKGSLKLVLDGPSLRGK